MTRILLFLILLAGAGMGTARAQPIEVRSGEHETFTRIVFAIPDGVAWSLASEPGRGTLTLDGFDEGFDLSRAFEIIPRKRLTSLLARPSGLELQLPCDCPITAFRESNGFLVIDIGDGPELPLQAPLSPAVVSSSVPRSEFSYGELLWRNTGPPPADPTVDLDQSDSVAAAGIDTTSNSVTPDEVFEATQDRLLEAFSNAASRGLLKPKSPFPEPSLPPPAGAAETEIFDSSALIEEIPAGGSGNIRITDSRDIPDTDKTENALRSAAWCPDPQIVSIADWGNDTPFWTQIGPSAQDLYDEFGRIQPEAAIRHARLLLHFGFGAEALTTLKLVPEAAARHPELIDIANIMEFGFVQNPRSLHMFSECDSDLALWAILAAEEIPPGLTIDTKAALRALLALPSHLRVFLAPALSTRLLQRGDLENASIAMRSYESLEETDGETPRMADALAADLRGEDREAGEILENVVNSDTSETPDAVIALIDKLARDDKDVPADLALLAEAFAVEHRHSEDGPAIFRAFLLAAVKSKQFQKAFEALAEPTSDISPHQKIEVTSALFSEVAGKASDAQFLEVYFDKFDDHEDHIDAHAGLDIAERLFRLGFFEEAFRVTSLLPADYTPDDRLLLEARLLLQSGDHAGSLQRIAGLEGSAASAIRAEVYESEGRNREAASLFDAARLPDRALASLWLSEQWSELIDEEVPVYGQLSRLTREPPVDLTMNGEMLSNSEAAIASSSSARTVIEEALNALRVSN